MKKKYIIPQIFLDEAQLEQMIAISLQNSQDGKNTADPEGEVLSRRSSIWEEEEEDF